MFYDYGTDFLICCFHKNSQQFNGTKVISTPHGVSSCKGPLRHFGSSLTGGATVYVAGVSAVGPYVCHVYVIVNVV